MGTFRFYFLRHGESQSNRDGILAGQLDSPLTNTGIAQAQTAASILRNTMLSAIYSSPLRRAADTAKTVANAHGLNVVAIDVFMERHFGNLQGQGSIEIEQLPSLPDGAESLNTLLQRVTDGLNRCEPLQDALIVGHSGTWRGICHALTMKADTQPIGNAEPIEVIKHDKGWRYAALSKS